MNTTLESALSTLQTKNYMRVSSNLAERSAKVAQRVMEKMDELQLEHLKIEDVGTLKKETIIVSGGSMWGKILYWDSDFSERYPHDLTSSTIGDGTDDGLQPDLYLFILHPNRDQVFRFAMNINEILKAIQDIENRMVSLCESGIEKLSTACNQLDMLKED